MGELFATLGGLSRHRCVGPKKYFFQTALSHQANSPVINLHNNFVPIAMFISLGSRIPSPPPSLGHFTYFQLTSGTFYG